MRGYDADLSFVHDAGFLETAEAAAGFVADLLAGAGLRAATVVEVGSGSGETARRLTAAGHRMVGFDQSEAMVRLARGRAPGAEFQVGSLYDLSLPPCDAVIAVGEVVNYAFDERASIESLKLFFGRVRDALAPGGLLVFDSAGPGRAPGGRYSGFRRGEDWAVLYEAASDRTGRCLTRRITTFRADAADPAVWRRSDETHELRLYSATELATALRRIGFRVRIRRGYGSLPMPPGLRVLVARRA